MSNRSRNSRAELTVEEIAETVPVGETFTVIKDEVSSDPNALHNVDVHDLYISIHEINKRLCNIETSVAAFINEIRPLIEDFVNSPVAKMIGSFFGGKGK